MEKKLSKLRQVLNRGIMQEAQTNPKFKEPRPDNPARKPTIKKLAAEEWANSMVDDFKELA
jgi:hypothetical protein